ncbi:CtsR family transcriptional regulator [Lacticaseibacillus pabuli]|uniref:Transcriptional regulator CtsR n=1 Tax=Lacticaseibacillus pabuli TaxID=3025672 RepID=A0ABY7WTB8_9LACO|nr:CtsR family transcriptional regulator [Lacticaseibacillus sp. KACC 23028]WDF82284.1 CtsR family transcriptional regulator [Lacticaseibacillus sp. KACC 23028]
MQSQNMSDTIESYLKAILAQQQQIEIRRAEIADRFNCVPSQINYVIKTRFTPQRGYVVESKRGGGGYIRIVKAQLRDDESSLALMRANVPARLRERDAQVMTQQLFDAQVISQQTGNAMLATMSHRTLGVADSRLEEMLRSRIFIGFLDSLRYE